LPPKIYLTHVDERKVTDEKEEKIVGEYSIA